jgi:hypothetical protein
MQVPKTLVVERVRSAAGSAAAGRADAELPEKVDLVAHADLLRELGVDPAALDAEYGGQAPGVG